MAALSKLQKTSWCGIVWYCTNNNVVLLYSGQWQSHGNVANQPTNQQTPPPHTHTHTLTLTHSHGVKISVLANTKIFSKYHEIARPYRTARLNRSTFNMPVWLNWPLRVRDW